METSRYHGVNHVIWESLGNLGVGLGFWLLRPDVKPKTKSDPKDASRPVWQS
jgi:hypothetical protein